MDIAPGSQVTVTISAHRLTPSAQKTLARVFQKDPAVRKASIQYAKPVVSSRRAGRYWDHRPRGSNQRSPELGDSATVFASLDVIRDLQSVAKYVTVQS